MKKIKLFLIFFLCQLIGTSQTNEFSYEGLFQSIEKQHPLFSQAQNQSAIGKHHIQMALGGYDPQVSASFHNKYFADKNYYSYMQGEIKQQLFASQYIKAGYEYGQGVFANPEAITPFYGLYYLSFETNLLQGLTFDKQRADILKSKQYKNFYSTERIILLNNLFFEAGLSYAEWAYAHKLMSLTTYYTLLAKQRLNAMNDLASIGERAAADTVEAAIFYQTRLLDYNIAKVEALEKATQVSNFYLNNQLINFTNGIKPTDTLDILFEKIKEKTMLLLKEDSLNNPILNQYQTKQNIFEIEKRFRKEMIKPKLSVNYNLISESQGNTLAQLSTNNYKWGASLNFPLLFRNTYNSFKIADLEATNNKMELDFKKLEIQYKNNLLKQTISVLSEQIVAAIKNVNYSKILLDAEKLKFNIGESSLFLLNTRENKLMETELKLAEYKLKYLKTVLKLIHLNGNLNYQL